MLGQRYRRFTDIKTTLVKSLVLGEGLEHQFAFLSADLIYKTKSVLQQTFVETVGFTLTVLNDFSWFPSQFSTNCHEIRQTLFSSDGATTLKTSWKKIV